MGRTRLSPLQNAMPPECNAGFDAPIPPGALPEFPRHNSPTGGHPTHLIGTTEASSPRVIWAIGGSVPAGPGTLELPTLFNAGVRMHPVSMHTCPMGRA